MRLSSPLSWPVGLGVFLVYVLLDASYSTAEAALEVAQPVPALVFDSGQPVAAHAVNKNLVHRAISDQEDHDLPSPRLRRRQTIKTKQPAPASADDFTAAAAKGCNLLYMIRASPSAALTRMQQNPSLRPLTDSQSSWNNADALAQYGWTEIKSTVNWAYMGIKEVTDELKIDTTDTKANLNVQLWQNKEVTVGTTKYASSGGTYDQAINVQAGLVVPYYIYSPAHEAKANNIPGTLVPLAQYSDVLYLEYSKLAGPSADVKGLNYVLFLNVENVDAWALVLTALKNKNGGKTDLPLWPGAEFSMDTDEGKALLATQIGAPLAWMLVQHKAAFPGKTVVKVRLHGF